MPSNASKTYSFSNSANALTVIKSTDRVTAESILAEAKKAVVKPKKETGIDEKHQFKTRAEAKVEVDDPNYAIQATIGTKEGAAEAISSIVGSAITDNVLKHADSTPKGVDKYHLGRRQEGPPNARCSRRSKASYSTPLTGASPSSKTWSSSASKSPN
jgi:hypothetical protein